MLARMWKTWNTYTLLIGLQSGAATLKNCFSKVTIWHSNSIVVQSLSRVQLFDTPWTAAPQASLRFTISPSLLKLMSTESVMPSSHLLLCRPFLLLPSIFPSFRGFSNQSTLRIRWPKYWSFDFSVSPSNEYSGLISFRMDSLNLLAVQGTLQSSPTPQFKSINSSALSFLYGPILISIHNYWKNHSFDHMDLCWQSNVSVFNMLSRFVTAFLPRSKHRLISWLQSPPAVILEPKKIKSLTVSIVSPSICHEVMGPNAMILVFSSWVLSQLFHSPLLPSLRSPSSLSAIRVVSSAYLRLLLFLPAILIPACASSNPTFYMMYSA